MRLHKNVLEAAAEMQLDSSSAQAPGEAPTASTTVRVFLSRNLRTTAKFGAMKGAANVAIKMLRTRRRLSGKQQPATATTSVTSGEVRKRAVGHSRAYSSTQSMTQ